jgi:kynureninase
MQYKNSLTFAKQQDKEDILYPLRNLFHIPKDKKGGEWLYFTGNSLGLQPKSTKKYIDQELEDWASLGVEGHFEAKNPWLNCNEHFNNKSSFVNGFFLQTNKNKI